jgi:hypothetical protein
MLPHERWRLHLLPNTEIFFFSVPAIEDDCTDQFIKKSPLTDVSQNLFKPRTLGPRQTYLSLVKHLKRHDVMLQIGEIFYVFVISRNANEVCRYRQAQHK